MKGRTMPMVQLEFCPCHLVLCWIMSRRLWEHLLYRVHCWFISEHINHWNSWKRSACEPVCLCETWAKWTDYYNSLTFYTGEKLKDYLRIYIHMVTFYMYVLQNRKTLNIQVLRAIKIQLFRWTFCRALMYLSLWTAVVWKSKLYFTCFCMYIRCVPFPLF